MAEFDKDRYERELEIREPERKRTERAISWAAIFGIICLVLIISAVQSCRAHG